MMHSVGVDAVLKLCDCEDFQTPVNFRMEHIKQVLEVQIKAVQKVGSARVIATGNSSNITTTSKRALYKK